MDSTKLRISQEAAVAALVKYETTMSSTISKSLEAIKECGLDKFIEDLSPLYACFGSIDELCTAFGCATTNDLESRLETLAMQADSCSDEAEAIEGYFSVYTAWTNFLTHCDQLLEESSSYPSIHSEKDLLSYRLDRLSELTTEKNTNVTMGDVLSKSPMTWMSSILAEGCQLVIVTRGVDAGARRWRQETGCNFPVYLDSSRELYTKMKMRRSLFKVFGPDTMKYFVEKKNAGGKFLSHYEDIPDDLIQMGGDIIFNKLGTTEFAHLSQSAADRPDLTKVLEIIKQRQNHI